MVELVIENDRLERWLSTSFLDEDGEIFLPAGAFEDELTAVLCLACDSVRVVGHSGHVYAPASWLAAQQPKQADAIRAIVANIHRRLEEGEGIGSAGEATERGDEQGNKIELGTS